MYVKIAKILFGNASLSVGNAKLYCNFGYIFDVVLKEVECVSIDMNLNMLSLQT